MTNTCGEWIGVPVGGASGSATFASCQTDTIVLTTNAFSSSATADKHYALYREVCGDGDILVHIAGVTPAGGYAGLELRENTAAGAKKFGMKTTLGSQINRFYRNATDGAVTQQNQTHQNIRWLKISRSGNVLAGYVSTNGQNWTQTMSQTIALNSCLQAGVFAHSFNSATEVTATFDDISLSGFSDPAAPLTEVFFLQDSLSAQAGDTVQICVGISNPCACAPTSLQVALQGSGQPHLSNFQSHTIIFQSNDSVSCFLLPIDDIDANGHYTFDIQSVSGGNNTQIIEPSQLSLRISFVIQMAYCGMPSTPDSQPEFPVVIDRFGFGYELGQITIDTSEFMGSERGFAGCDCMEEFGINLQIFDLWFEDCRLNTGTGFGDPLLGSDRRRVACQAFADLEAIIVPQYFSSCAIGNHIVNIQVLPSQITPTLNVYSLLPPEILGVGSGYMFPEQGLVVGIPWRLINTNSLPSPFFESINYLHGYMRINFDNPDINYSLNVNQPPFSSTQYDLYSVTWHEALHILGFQSLVKEQIPRTFSLYDQYLKLLNGNNTQNIIEPNGAVELRWDFIPGLNPDHPDLYSSCQNNTGVFGPDMIFQTSSANIPVSANNLTPSLRLQSHSHIYPNCDNSNTSDYIMAPGLIPGIRKTISQDEMNILCQIGYTISQSEGYTCGCTVSGTEDYGPDCETNYRIPICQDLIIYSSDLKANDHPNVESISELRVVNSYQGEVFPFGNSDFVFTPNMTGTITLAYIPIGCNGKRGNTTYVFVYVYEDASCQVECNLEFSCQQLPTYELPIYCFENHNCTASNPCNLLCNPMFCGMNYSIAPTFNGKSGVIDPPLFYNRAAAMMPSWSRTHGTPDLEITNTPALNIGADFFSGNTEGVMTYVDISENQRYLFSISIYGFRELYSSSKLSVDLINGEGMAVSSSLADNANYSGPLQNIFQKTQMAGPEFFGNLGTCFTADASSYNALWINMPPSVGDASSSILNVELVEDNFSDGEDVTSTDCGIDIQLGDIFCMLSQITICYEWFEVAANNGLVPIASYRVHDGQASQIQGAIDPVSHLLTVNPNETTTYVLRRTICDYGDIDESFELCLDFDEVIVFVNQDLPDPLFNIQINNCELTLIPNDVNAIHYWEFGDINETVSSDISPVFSYSVNGIYSVIHTVTNGCGSQISTQTIQINECCEAPIPQANYQFDAIDICGLYRFQITDPLPNGFDFVWGIDGLSYTGDEIYHQFNSSGEYSLTLSVINECGQSVTYNQPLEVVISQNTPVFSYTQNNCIFDFTSIDITPGLQHSWLFGDVTPPITSTEMNPVGIMLSEGVHVVIHTVTGICGVSTYSENVTVVSDPDLSLLVATNECGFITVSIDGIAPEHSWVVDYDDGLPTSAQLSHIYSAPGIYTVSATVTHECGVTTVETTITASPCLLCQDCAPANTIGAENPVMLSDIIQQGEIPDGIGSGINKCIAGTLIIDQDYSFVNSTLLMQPGARIQIQNNAALSVVNSSLSGCDQMWQGIELEKGAAIKMISSYLSDAQYALYVHPAENGTEPEPELTLQNNHFINNYVGLYVPPTPYAKINAFVADNYFTQTSTPLLAPYQGQAGNQEGLPAQENQALAGILINDLGAFSSLKNHFQGLTAGIVANRCFLAVNGNDFKNIRPDAGEYTGFDGRGAAVSCRSTGHTTTLALGNFFDDCFMGVRSNYTKLSARNNQMSNTEWGILASLANVGGITAEENNISDCRFGIVVAHANPSGSVIIAKNEISTNSEAEGVGIWLLNNKAPSIIQDNIPVIVKGAGVGIGLSVSNQASVINNTVILDNTEMARAGIALSYAQYNEVRDNTIKGAGLEGPPEKNIGLEIVSSPGNAYCCNAIDNTRLGVSVSGGSLATNQFRGTTFGNHTASLYLPNANAVLGSQNHTQNRWTGTGAAMYGVTPEYAQLYPFIVDLTPPNGSSEFIPVAHSPLEWFRVENNPESLYECLPIVCSLDNFEGESEDIKRIAGADTSLTDATLWELRRYAYDKLYGINIQDSIVQAFLLQSAANSVGAFYDVNTGISGLSLLNSAQVETLKNNLFDADSKLDSLIRIDEALATADSAQFSVLWAIRSQLTASSLLVAIDNKNIANLLQNDIASVSDNLISLNEEIQVSTIFENNEQLFNDIYLRFLGNPQKNADSADVIALQIIANQCPLTNGNAVYKARGLLDMLAQEMIHYDDPLACEPSQLIAPYPHFNQAIQTSTPKLSIYPNPTINEVQVRWVGNIEQQGRIILSDVFGRQIQAQTIPVGSDHCTLALFGLAGGLYILEVELNGVRWTEKIIINK